MRIGIYTLPFHTNYGGILQAFALQTVLEREGHEVWVIEERRRDFVPFRKWFISYPWRMYLKYVRKQNTCVFYEYHYNHRLRITQKEIRPFINRYIHIRQVDRLSDIQPFDFDAIIVGSDQVWNPNHYQGRYCLENAFLQFARNWPVKRMAYAVSFGSDSIQFPPYLMEECRSLSKMFDVVTVREDTAIPLCKKYFDVDAFQVLDPTLLLRREDYQQLVADADTQESLGSLFVHILDESLGSQQLCQRVAREHGMTSFQVNSKAEDIFWPNVGECVQPPVEQWVRSFIDAEMVVTDSFHGCVLSIIFEKPFYVIGNRKRGLTRVASLLRLFNIEEKSIIMLDGDDDVGQISIGLPIVVDLKGLGQWEDTSLNLIRKCLKENGRNK